jgi:mono/diheme cytochrome c family protein
MLKIALLLPALSLAGQNIWAQDIWDGVYTSAQAERGRTAYDTSCTNCHNRDLAGSVRAPALKGDRFMLSWQNGSVNSLYSKIRFSMPATYPETVSDEAKLDMVAYLLQVNGFPSGRTELKMNADELDAIQIVKKGASELPNFVLVQVVGCLEAGPSKTWRLAHASDPIATKEDSPIAKVKVANQTFLLISAAAFKPETHTGETVAVKGLLYKEPGENRLNLISFQTLAPGCSTN